MTRGEIREHLRHRSELAQARVQAQVAKLMLERELQGHVTALVKALGGQLYHTRDSRGSEAGWPDCAIWVPERPTVLTIAELKRQSEGPTADQVWWAEVIQGCETVEYHLWKPSDWLSGEIERALR